MSQGPEGPASLPPLEEPLPLLELLLLELLVLEPPLLEPVVSSPLEPLPEPPLPEPPASSSPLGKFVAGTTSEPHAPVAPTIPSADMARNVLIDNGVMRIPRMRRSSARCAQEENDHGWQCESAG